MPSTPIYQIPYPDGTTGFAPLQDKFAAIATGVENALVTGLGGAPRIATSDAQRTSIYPAPVQGNSLVRTDKGYTEAYFELYNASTNPGGATPAGWYPISGAIPVGVARRTTTTLQVGNGAYANISANAAWNAVTHAGVTYSNGFIVPFAGLYQVEWSALFTSGTNGIIGIAVNAAGTPGGETLHAVGPMVSNAAATGNGTATVTLGAGDTVTLWGYGVGAAAALNNTANTATHWGVRWLRPNSA